MADLVDQKVLEIVSTKSKTKNGASAESKENGEKRRKKRLKQFFHFLGGGDSPLEALELALGRNEKLQKCQLESLRSLVRSMDTPYLAMSLGYQEIKTLTNFLLKCNFLPLIVRLLSLTPTKDCLVEKGSSWREVHYFTTAALKHSFRDIETDSELQEVMKTNTVEILLTNALKEDDLLLAFQSLYALRHLCAKIREPMERVVFSGQTRKIGELLSKDTCQKRFIKVLRQGFEENDIELLRDCHYVPKVYYHLKEGEESLRDELNIFMKMSYEHQQNAAYILFKIADTNERHRKLIMNDPTTFKAIYRWFKSPVINETDLDLLEQCSQTVGCLCLSEEITANLFENHKFLKCIKMGLFLPEVHILYKFLDIVGRICRFSRQGKLRLAQDEDIVKVLIQFLFSFNEKIQLYAFQAIVLMAGSSETAKYLYTYGLRPKHIFALEKFYNDTLVKGASILKRDLHRNCSREWKGIDRECERDSYFRSLDHCKAFALKNAGNDHFKKEDYINAIMAYSEAIEYAPPALEKKTIIENGTVTRIYDNKSWHVPAVLYSNRAQCFLKMENWSKALDDCNEALSRCLEDKEESKKLLVKTPYRRAKAFMELGDYHRALNDISVCLRRAEDNDDIKLLYKEILSKYRTHVGTEHIRRCGYCWGGEGDKLKRCANCKEIYCSRECQTMDWDVHRNFCTSPAM